MGAEGAGWDVGDGDDVRRAVAGGVDGCLIRKGVFGNRRELNGCRDGAEDLGGLLLMLIFLLGRGLFGGIRSIKHGFSTCDDILNFHSRTLLCKNCRLVLTASIPDDSPNNGEQNECANNAARNRANIRTSIAGSTRSHTDGHCALVAGARRDEAE